MPNDQRHNDARILELLGDLRTNLALNTQTTSELRDYQKTANGKLAAHESRLQAIEGANALTASTIAQLAKVSETATGTKSRWIERFMWVGLGLLCLVLYNILLRVNLIQPLIKP